MVREGRGLREDTGRVSSGRTRWLACRAQAGWESLSEPPGMPHSCPGEPQPQPLGIGRVLA